MSVDLLGPRLARSLEALASAGREPGGSLCLLTAEGSAVACAGDDGRGSAWRDHTLVMTYSCAKPLVALTVLSAVAEGRLRLDQPVAELWPAYAAQGKGATTVADVLSHRAGQPAFQAASLEAAFDDREALVAALASAAPELPPGDGSAEHALTYGHLCDELVRRACDETLADRFARIADAHGWDLHLAVADADLPRVADVEPLGPGWPRDYLDDPRWAPVLSRPPGLLAPAVVNSRRFRQHCFGAISLHASAAGLARFYADLPSDSGPVAGLLGASVHRAFLTTQVTGVDAVIGREVSWTLGLQADTMADGSVELGMGGIGGCCAWVRVDASGGLAYAFAYVSRGLGDGDRVDALGSVLEEVWPVEP